MMKRIAAEKIKPDCQVTVPGSKSYTHRILIAAALSQGTCQIRNGLQSDDTHLTMDALRSWGVPIAVDGVRITVQGCSGRWRAREQPIYLANSGTSMRLLTAVAALGQGPYILDGSARMRQRPLEDLLSALRQIGVSAESLGRNGCPPVRVAGGTIRGGPVAIDCSTSSQYLSALLLTAPLLPEGLDIRVEQGPVSKPYIDMTVEVMKRMGVAVRRDGYERFRVDGRQTYLAGDYAVEPDCSQAGYFWAAAAICGSRIKVRGISAHTRQGDLRFTELLEAMGCRVFRETDGIAVEGGPLSAVEADMADMPDLVPTLAVVAAFARGTTVIRNVAHLKVKESDRLTATASELAKMGVAVECGSSGLKITGGGVRAAQIDTYDDHRMAMSFALAGLRVPGLIIRDPHCVAKSFPNYWRVFETLYAP